MGFEAGDFLLWENQPGNERLCISPTTIRDGWPKENITILYLDFCVGYIVHGEPTQYVKIKPSIELIKKAQENLKNALNEKEFDNLTYIEICAKLREYEHSF